MFGCKCSVPDCRDGVIFIGDVKEFIKRLKEDFMSCNDMPNTTEQETRVMDYVLKKIDKLAGEDLVDQELKYVPPD